MALAALIPILATVGAPLLKRLIEGQLGGAAGEVGGAVVDAIAGQIGVEPTPAAIEAAYNTNPLGVGAAIQQVEIERREDWAAMLSEVNRTIRAEHKAQGLLTRTWRPLFGVEFGLVYSAIGVAFVYAIFAAADPITGFAQLGGFIITYLGFGASVLGVYVWQRSQEKKVGAA